MNWENLTAGEFRDSIGKTGGVCLVPIGCMEKHGSHLPLGTDIAIAREIARRAAAIEEFMIFPYYPFGFVNEVKHKAGTVALRTALQFEILEQTCEEIARNGYRKIVFGSGHGGNTHGLRAFAQSLLERRRDYLVYVRELWWLTPEQKNAITSKHGVPPENVHGDRVETACWMALAPECVHMERFTPGEGKRLDRLRPIESHGVYTVMNWYGDYPNQIAGDPAGATAGFGNDVMDLQAENLVAAIREIKRDGTAARLLAEFYDATGHPGG